MALFGLVISLASCGDEITNPADLDLAFLATRFDEFAHERDRATDAEGARHARATAVALRMGIRPERVSITLDGEAGEWLALEQEYAIGGQLRAGPLPLEGLVMRRFVAWQGVGPSRILVLTLDGDTATYPDNSLALERPSTALGYFTPHAALFERGEGYHVATSGGARSIRARVGEACPRMPRRIPFLTAANPVYCYRGEFATHFTITLIDVSSVERSLRAREVRMIPQLIPGIQLGYPPLPTF